LSATLATPHILFLAIERASIPISETTFFMLNPPEKLIKICSIRHIPAIIFQTLLYKKYYKKIRIAPKKPPI
jgi:hypothetical protein